MKRERICFIFIFAEHHKNKQTALMLLITHILFLYMICLFYMNQLILRKPQMILMLFLEMRVVWRLKKD